MDARRVQAAPLPVQAQYVLDQAGIGNVTCIAQPTSSAGVARATGDYETMKDALYIRLWLLNNTALSSAQGRAWAREVNARLGLKLIDPAPFTAHQVIYTAKPNFIGFADPVPNRWMLLPGASEVANIDPPQEVFTGAMSACRASPPQGETWRTHLERIGSEEFGFYQPILSVIGAAVHEARGMPPNLEEIISSIRGRIVDRSHLRPPDDIQKYASADYLLAKFRWASQHQLNAFRARIGLRPIQKFGAAGG
ncbi:MAG: hypothetical protein JOY71_20980 [Acetobacteraceae bacterium]|nr:hypothetical protein [Acetobacteraceae bacterium]MBV8524563.1 hypothetical protein [Acetobacteraceae bacterium]